jgi:cytochrome c oxidase subunit 2
VIQNWLPLGASSFSGDVDGVFRLILYVVGAWFILVEALILFFVIRYRRRRAGQAVYVTGETAYQLAWILIPGLIVLLLDLGIDASGARAWGKIKEQTPAAAFKARVTAERFAWLFTYPGPDRRFGTEDDLWEVGTLHVPVGQPVELEMNSMDVIHSFAVPNFRLRQDILPGRTIKAWFEATQPGSYEIECTELCGAEHYKMQGKVIALDAKEYERWSREHWPAAPVRPQDQPKTASAAHGGNE